MVQARSGGADGRARLDFSMNMDYRLFYDMVMEEELKLRACDVTQDYQLCHTLSALYQLQEYLAAMLPEEEDSDPTTSKQ